MKGKHRNIVLTTVKLKDLWSLFVIGLQKVQTQNLLFTFTWNVKKAQNNFVPIFNSKVGVRLIHECDLYSSKYGKSRNQTNLCRVEELPSKPPSSLKTKKLHLDNRREGNPSHHLKSKFQRRK